MIVGSDVSRRICYDFSTMEFAFFCKDCAKLRKEDAVVNVIFREECNSKQEAKWVF